MIFLMLCDLQVTVCPSLFLFLAIILITPENKMIDCVILLLGGKFLVRNIYKKYCIPQRYSFCQLQQYDQNVQIYKNDSHKNFG